MRIRIFIASSLFLVSSFTFAEPSENNVPNRCDSILQRVHTSCSGGDNWGACFGAQLSALINGCL